ncbi:pyrroline-5-carboxylate reductase [Persicobacter sp. CCB-QB2]|uniref:pyrroline-5-carboxylate reductase n=1 Tax=Persicobacter sp. CCB-QB2 TaxID=1561025 RepID=UPI0006A95B39|nr:pyrroline-5-carboxylate reductase [Persicobacter sp. CCB-QB2]
MSRKIAIIGGGNLGSAIAFGLIDQSFIQAESLFVTRRQIAKLGTLAERGVNVLSDNLFAAQQAEWIIIAVKPHLATKVLEEIKSAISPDKTVISVVTGVSLEQMRKAIGEGPALFRAMPNTAIAIRESMTCIAAADAPESTQKEVVELFNQVGQAIIINEELMNSATVLGACGIAYALRFIRAASQGGIEIGFPAEVAQLIASQTVKGAASLLIENKKHPEFEIDKVTTPQGCTIAGLNEMEHQGFSSALIKGIMTSYLKIDKIPTE